MKATTRIDISRAVRGLHNAEQAVERGIVKILHHVAALGQKLTRQHLRPYKQYTGRLERAIVVEVKEAERKARVSVDDNEAPYGKYVVGKGTGIYGPTGRPIRPKRGEFLVFRPSGGANFVGPMRLVFAREVKGMKGKQAFTQAHRQLQGIAQVEASRIMLAELRAARGGA